MSKGFSKHSKAARYLMVFGCLAFCGIPVFSQRAFAKTVRKATPTPSSKEPLNLDLSDIYPGKSELLKQADELTILGEKSASTEQYAASYLQFQRGLEVVKPPVGSWNSDERAKVKSVPAPTKDALNRYYASKQQAEARVDRRINDVQSEHERLQKLKAAERRAEAREQRVAEEAARRDAQIDALDRNTEALYDHDDYYPIYYGPVATFTPFPQPPQGQTPWVKPGPGIIPQGR